MAYSYSQTFLKPLDDGIAASSTSPSSFTLMEGMERATHISRRLRGRDVDPSSLVPEVQEIMKAQINSIESMQKMYVNGDETGLASAFRSQLADNDPSGFETALEESDSKFPTELSLDAIQDLQAFSVFGLGSCPFRP